jgi:RimJ/RimL family protein N-acetyltransferase
MTLIETSRLILRPTQLDDLDRWAELLADAQSARFIGGVQPKPVVWRILMSQAGAWALSGVAMFSVIEKKTGRWIGRVGPWQPFAWPGTEVGWGLHPDSCGKGYALEAARASMTYAFDTLGWTDVIHCIHPENAASQRVAVKLGSVNRGPGTMPPPYDHEPIDIWGQSREEFRRAAGAR